jgi:hypothetical protein
MYDFEKYDSMKKYIEDKEAKSIETLIKWCKENKSSKDKGASLAAQALIKYLTKGEFPYSQCRAKKERGQFKKMNELDYYIWAYARRYSVMKASREFKINATKIDKKIKTKFEPKTIRDHIHKVADDLNTDYKTIMESNSLPHADLKNKEKHTKPRGLLLLSLIFYYKYLEETTEYRRPKTLEDEEILKVHYENSAKEEAKAEASGKFMVRRYFRWQVKAHEFDKKGK